MRRRMKGQAAAFVRAAGAALLLGVLVVGVPYLLVSTVGNPLPASIPTVDEIRILLTQNGQGFTNFLIGTLAVLIWAIWIQLMIALVVEIAATIGQRETRRLRIAPGLQPFVARLVAAVTLATTLAAGPLLAPAVGALSFADVVQPNPVTVAVASVSQHVSPTAVQQAEVAAPSDSIAASTMVVADHTELWDLAEAAYGDGVSWKLIAQANAGLPDALGTVITGDTEMVAPGTELRLPGAVNPTALGRFGTMESDAVSTLAEAPMVAADQVVQPGDSMWSVAESEVERRLDRPGSEAEIAEYWSDVVAANADVTSGDVDLIYPGETLSLPGNVEATVPAQMAEQEIPDTAVQAAEAEEQSLSHSGTESAAALVGIVDGPIDSRTSTEHSKMSSEASPATPSTGSSSIDAPSASPDGATAPVPAPRSTNPSGSVPVPALGMTALGAAMLGAGIVSAVRRRRDLQRRTRPQGTRARPASPEAAVFEAALAHMADEVHESKLGHGWRVLPASAVPGLVPAATAIDSDPAHRLAAPIVMRGEDAASIPTTIAPSASPAPVSVATVIIGTDQATGDAVLIDLAAVHALRLQGSDGDVRTVARSVVLDLAVSDRCDSAHVIAVGVATELADLDRVHPVQSFDEASALALRMAWLSSDATTPVVVVAASDHQDAAGIATLLQAGALVVGPGIEAESWIEITDDQATLQPEGRDLLLAALADAQYRSVSELVDTTSGTALEVVDEAVDVHHVLDVVTANECSVEPGTREVKVLGPVEVAGVESFSSLKAVDVVAYLAFHRHGVDADQIKTWVWPTFDPPTDKAFANVMSRARTGLGADADGAPYLSRAGADKTYRLAEAVTTDFDRFRALADLAEQADDTAVTLDLYRQALELIRGVPFTGGAASSFSWADNHVRAQVEYTIDEAVHRCADLAIEAEDLATARAAALKGLELVPGCEQCFRRRFLIARAGNNRTELRRAMADLEASAMIDMGEPEAVDLISGDLLDLYHELDRALVGRAS